MDFHFKNATTGETRTLEISDHIIQNLIRDDLQNLIDDNDDLEGFALEER